MSNSPEISSVAAVSGGFLSIETAFFLNSRSKPVLQDYIKYISTHSLSTTKAPEAVEEIMPMVNPIPVQEKIPMAYPVPEKEKATAAVGKMEPLDFKWNTAAAPYESAQPYLQVPSLPPKLVSEPRPIPIVAPLKLAKPVDVVLVIKNVSITLEKIVKYFSRHILVDFCERVHGSNDIELGLLGREYIVRRDIGVNRNPIDCGENSVIVGYNIPDSTNTTEKNEVICRDFKAASSGNRKKKSLEREKKNSKI